MAERSGEDEAVSEEKKEKIKREVHLGEIERILKGKFGRAMLDSRIAGDELVVKLNRDRLFDFCRFAHQEEKLSFDYLRCLSGVDYPDQLEVVYHLYSMKHGSKITLKVPLPKDDPVVASATPVWQGADWHEREAAEMFGIVFEGHPDPRKLLLVEDWEDHPLRKDYRLPYEFEKAEPD